MNLSFENQVNLHAENMKSNACALSFTMLYNVFVSSDTLETLERKLNLLHEFHPEVKSFFEVVNHHHKLCAKVYQKPHEGLTESCLILTAWK